MKPEKGYFITFEGMDGSGKTTQIRALSTALTEQGINHIVTREPGGTTEGEHLRSLLLTQSQFKKSRQGDFQGLSPLSQALIFSGARRHHLETVIWPALKKGTWVLCDRYEDSTQIYQGVVGGLSQSVLEKIKTVTMHPHLQLSMPDLTFVLMLSPEESFHRCQKESDNVFDYAPLAMYRKVFQGYETLAQREDRCIAIDASKNIQTVTNDILSHIPFSKRKTCNA